ncbi:uncharacterized protein SCHCODRAFT_01171178 [Schizophyllum commune H4-8]|nr:uncharacterized protein SCHCODRAFT_01171178 [Schizophyllum commune H4-8]KAI5895182.1 hypothetical protein SCHCODRAFT_01171178 [Schizophyllum commune H4-8]
MDSLPMTSILRLARVNKQMRERVQAYLGRALDVRKAFKPFVPEDAIPAFRRVQRDTGAVVSGSVALKFMGRYDFEVSDMDVYVPQVNAIVVHDFLVAIGYTFRPRTNQEPTFEEAFLHATAVWSVHTASYLVSSLSGAFDFVSANGCTVQVMTCRRGVADVVLDFHSTAVMNMISHSHAYSLYPQETFENMRSLAVRAHDTRPKVVQALAKYRQRGWDILTCISLGEASNPERTFGRRYRFVGDSASWVYPLPSIPYVSHTASLQCV